MKIGVVSPAWVRVPPEQYGGIEVVVHLLVEELVKRGVDVTLFASGDSVTSANLRSIYPKAIGFPVDQETFDVTHTAWAYSQADEFDIIHNNVGMSGVNMASLIKTPVVTTLHNNYFSEDNKEFLKLNRDSQFYVPISDAQKEEIKGLRFTRTVYNAIDTDLYPYEEEKDDYLVCIGNLIPVKGHDIAIEVAKRLKMQLRLAGKFDKHGIDYFGKKIKPEINDSTIFYEGQVDQDRKAELFSKAKAMLFPIRWREPFGLVMVEAMACGTPVIAFNRGSVPEVVKDGETGFIVNDVDEMVEAVKKIDQISPDVCRRHVIENFGQERMGKNYLSVFQNVIEASTHRAFKHKAV